MTILEEDDAPSASGKRLRPNLAKRKSLSVEEPHGSQAL
jgi:hypothetical protein